MRSWILARASRPTNPNGEITGAGRDSRRPAVSAMKAADLRLLEVAGPRPHLIRAALIKKPLMRGVRARSSRSPYVIMLVS